MRLSKTALAEVLGVSTAEVSKFVDRGAPTQGDRFDSADFLRWMANDQSGGDPLTALETEMKVVRTSQARLELAVQRGEVVDMYDAHDHGMTIMIGWKSGLLALPARLAQLGVSKTTEQLTALAQAELDIIIEDAEFLASSWREQHQPGAERPSIPDEGDDVDHEANFAP